MKKLNHKFRHTGNTNRTFPFSDITQNDAVTAQGDWVIYHLYPNESKILPAINVMKIVR